MCRHVYWTDEMNKKLVDLAEQAEDKIISWEYIENYFGKKSKTLKDRLNKINCGRFAITSQSDGCQYCQHCFECPLPACIHDGYDPTRPVNKDYSQEWTSKETLKLKRLMNLHLSYEVLGNILDKPPKSVEMYATSLKIK